MSIPKSVVEYVQRLNEREARAQLARLIAKLQRQQRISDSITHVEISGVEWDPLNPEQCAGCHATVHAYSTAVITAQNTKTTYRYCSKCHDEQWSWV